MNIVLLQSKLKLEEIDQLLKEFPQFLFLSLSDEACKNMTPEQWSRVEIFFGTHLNKEELSKAHQLKWVQVALDDHRNISLDIIKQQENILVTDTPPSNIDELCEFVTAAILSYAKNLPRWQESMHFPNLIWDSKWKESMWKLKETTLLQIGLGRIGTELTKRCRELGMRVWGVQEKRSFHPYCHKTISKNNLHSVLPNIEIVVLSLPKGREYRHLFGKAELQLMHKESVLLVVGNNRAVDEEGLIEVLNNNRLRGVLIDNDHSSPISPSSRLWKRENVLITPEIAVDKELMQRQAFQTFRYNMRQYLHGNINDMKNIVTLNIKKSLTL